MLGSLTRAGGLVLIGWALAGPGAGGASAAPSSVRLGGVPRLPSSATVTGAVAGARPMHVTIALRPHDPAALARLVEQVSDPRSSLFRHYLSVPQFARRFGAAPRQVAAVRRALAADGLRVGTATANALTIPVSGSAATMRRAFSTALSRVRLADGRSAFVNTSAPAVPTSLAGDVQAVVGLDDLHVPQPLHSRVRFVRPAVGSGSGGPQPCSAATAVTAAQLGYTADTIAAAYGFPSLYATGDQGAGQTIALYELEPLDGNDTNAYQSCYGTSTPLSTVDVDGGGTPIPDGDQEAALDSEIVIGLAPRAHVIVYSGPQDTGALDVYSAIMSADIAKVVSVSWVECERDAARSGLDGVRAEATLFAEAAVQGQSILVGSGDHGSSECASGGSGGPADTGLAVADPASQPNVTAVGGTSLYTTNSTGAPIAWSPGHPEDEGVWNGGVSSTNGLPFGSTGGRSEIWAMPAYQSSAAPALGVVNAHSGGGMCGRAYCRQTPDVSADGAPSTGYVVYTNSALGHGWEVIGGTSASTPVWAALTALTNAQPACRGLPVGFENPSLYALAGVAYTRYFRDVRVGDPITGRTDNDAAGANGGLYPVTAGYDLATGLGVPQAGPLAGRLCALRAPVHRVTVVGPGDRTAFLHTRVALAMHAVDSAGAALAYSAIGLPPGLTISSVRGVISGKPTKTGSYPVTVRAVDLAANAGQARFVLTVRRPPPTFTRVRLTGIARRRPRLSFTITKGRYSPPIRSVTVRLPRGLTFNRGGGGVQVDRPVRFAVGFRRSTLTVAFSRTQGRASVTIAPPTIVAGASLVRRARRHGVVILVLTATDQSRSTAGTTVRVALMK